MLAVAFNDGTKVQLHGEIEREIREKKEQQQQQQQQQEQQRKRDSRRERGWGRERLLPARTTGDPRLEEFQ